MVVLNPKDHLIFPQNTISLFSVAFYLVVLRSSSNSRSTGTLIFAAIWKVVLSSVLLHVETYGSQKKALDSLSLSPIEGVERAAA